MENNGLDLKVINQQILDVQNGKSNVNQKGEGVVLLKNYSRGITSTGKAKYSGIISNMEETTFQIWNNKSAFNYLEEQKPEAGSSVVKITYEISRFGLIIETMECVEGYHPDDFIKKRYNMNQKLKEFYEALKTSNVTDKGIDVVKMLLHVKERDQILERVCKEFAALSHHDNCQTGLLAHTTKCIQLYNGVKGPYEFLKDERTNDLMVIALAIHDIGKIFEMNNGTYQKYSYVTHRGLGMEYLLKYKDQIIELYDEEFFYMLYSVIQQHHDEYGEGAKTLYSFLVHMIDNMDATFSSIDEMIQNEEYTTDEAGTKLKFNDRYFNVFGKKQ